VLGAVQVPCPEQAVGSLEALELQINNEQSLPVYPVVQLHEFDAIQDPLEEQTVGSFESFELQMYN
jgi:hypothetical protein